MTAIDTSKLKEGMVCSFRYEGVSHDNIPIKITSDGNIETTRIERLLLIGKNGVVHDSITDLVFPDLQEQDRVEAWEPGQRYEFSTDGENWTEHAFLGKHKNYFIAVCHSHITTQYIPFEFMRPIPKPDPDGELRELILEACAYCLGYGQSSPSLEQSKVKTVVNSALEKFDTISQIKSLLAAKIPNVTREQFESKFVELIGANGNSMGSYTAWLTFLHFTKNETK